MNLNIKNLCSTVFNCYGQPIFEFDRIRLFVDKQAFATYSRKNKIAKLQSPVASINESKIILDFFKKGNYRFDPVPFDIIDRSKIKSFYQIYGDKGMIFNPQSPPLDIKNEVIKTLFLNYENADLICSEFMNLILKIEIFYNEDVIFSSLPQRILSESECQYFSILRWANLTNKEYCFIAKCEEVGM